MTSLIPPRGFSTSPSRRGIRWAWTWNTVCPQGRRMRSVGSILTPWPA